jgi:hypothetical protein
LEGNRSKLVPRHRLRIQRRLLRAWTILTVEAWQHYFDSARIRERGCAAAVSVNVGWGAFNIVVGYVLVLRVGTFDLRDTWDAVAIGVRAVRGRGRRCRPAHRT